MPLFSYFQKPIDVQATQNYRIPESVSAAVPGLETKNNIFCEWVINVIRDAIPTDLLYPSSSILGMGETGQILTSRLEESMYPKLTRHCLLAVVVINH